MDPLESEIAALGGLSAHDLRIAWRRLHRDKPPRCMSRDLMIRSIAYRMQERAHGGLAPATRRRLRAVVGEVSSTSRSSTVLPGRPKTKSMPFSSHHSMTSGRP
jgi:hypothetical protein